MPKKASIYKAPLYEQLRKLREQEPGVFVFDRLRLDEHKFPRRLIGSERGDVLIVGTGRCVWEDLRGLPVPSHVMAVNDIGMHLPMPVKHWYSSDIEQLLPWWEGRRRAYVREHGNATLHSCGRRNEPRFQIINHWPFQGGGGSGLKAILVALGLGYESVTVAGMPFDDSGHYYDPPVAHNLRKDRNWSGFTSETPDALMRQYLPIWRGRVRFLSGRGREMMERG